MNTLYNLNRPNVSKLTTTEWDWKKEEKMDRLISLKRKKNRRIEYFS